MGSACMPLLLWGSALCSFPVIKLFLGLNLIKAAPPGDHPMLALGVLSALALGEGGKQVLSPGNTEANGAGQGP